MLSGCRSVERKTSDENTLVFETIGMGMGFSFERERDNFRPETTGSLFLLGKYLLQREDNDLLFVFLDAVVCSLTSEPPSDE